MEAEIALYLRTLTDDQLTATMTRVQAEVARRAEQAAKQEEEKRQRDRNRAWIIRHFILESFEDGDPSIAITAKQVGSVWKDYNRSMLRQSRYSYTPVDDDIREITQAHVLEHMKSLNARNTLEEFYGIRVKEASFI